MTYIIILLAGALLRYVIKRRRFYRRNFAGYQRFSSYHRAWLTLLAERIVYTLASIAIIIAGILLWYKW